MKDEMVTQGIQEAIFCWIMGGKQEIIYRGTTQEI